MMPMKKKRVLGQMDSEMRVSHSISPIPIPCPSNSGRQKTHGCYRGALFSSCIDVQRARLKMHADLPENVSFSNKMGLKNAKPDVSSASKSSPSITYYM
jgi:hypothetical protein